MKISKFTAEEIELLKVVKSKSVFLVAQFDGKVRYQSKKNNGSEIDLSKFVFRAAAAYSMQILTDKGLNDFDGALFELQEQFTRVVAELKREIGNERKI